MCQKQHPNIVSEQNWQVIHNKDKVDENRDRTHLTHQHEIRFRRFPANLNEAITSSKTSSMQCRTHSPVTKDKVRTELLSPVHQQNKGCMYLYIWVCVTCVRRPRICVASKPKSEDQMKNNPLQSYIVVNHSLAICSFNSNKAIRQMHALNNRARP